MGRISSQVEPFPPFAVLTTTMKMLLPAVAGYLIFPFHVASFPSFFFAVLPVVGLAYVDGSGEVYFALPWLLLFFVRRRCNLGMRKTDCVGRRRSERPDGLSPFVNVVVALSFFFFFLFRIFILRFQKVRPAD